MKKKLFFLLVAGVIAMGFYGVISFRSTSGPRAIFEVEKGASAGAVAQELEEKGLVRSALVFKWYLKKEGLSEKIQAGRYVIPQGSDLPAIAQLLVSGRSAEFPVTFPEGVTAEEMGAILEKEDLTSQTAFMECVRTCSFDFDFLPSGPIEGYLFPDTYFADPANFDNRVFISRLLETFQHRLSSDDWQAVRSSSRSLHEIVIMASMVEAEERSEKNRPVVAGILWKRYDAGAGLGVDATVRYALKKPTAFLTQNDLQTDSPYNTRKYRGLPPTAIGNPGLSSLRAALRPTPSNFWYYLHDAEGRIHYARTLEEHNANKRQYILAQ